jgi:hypothetical protein
MYSAWANYRFWWRLWLLLFLGYIPGMLAIVYVSIWILDCVAVSYVAFFAWIAALATSWIRAVAFTCPRCGHTFFHRGWFTNGFARKCLHCGLRKWAEPGQKRG